MANTATLIVAPVQGLTTNYEADRFFALRHDRRMLSHDELLAKLRQLRDDGVTSNAKLARLLQITTSRVADIFATDRTPRKITVDEMKTLVEHFGLNDLPAQIVEVADIFAVLDHREQRRAIKLLRTMVDDDGEAATA